MSLNCIFCDGFDYSNLLTLLWNSANDAGIDLSGTLSRTGLGCIVLGAGPFGPKRAFNASDHLLCGTAFFPNGLPGGTKANIMWLISSATSDQQIRVCVEPDASVSVYNGNDPFPLKLAQSAANTLQVSAYNYITCKALIAASGSVQVWVNGQLVIDVSGVRTRVPGSAASADTLQLLGVSGSSSRHDDSMLWTWTDPSDVITAVPSIYPALPSADSTPLDWTPSTGLTHFNLVDDVPQDTTDYVSSSTVGQEDQYIHSIPLNQQVPPLPSSYSILAIQHQVLAEIDAAGARSIGLTSNGVVGPDHALTTNYVYAFDDQTPGPLTTLADLATVPFGQQVTA